MPEPILDTCPGCAALPLDVRAVCPVCGDEVAPPLRRVVAPVTAVGATGHFGIPTPRAPGACLGTARGVPGAFLTVPLGPARSTREPSPRPPSPAAALEALAGHLPDLLGRASPIARTIASTSRDEQLTRTGGPQRTLALRAARRLEALWHRERPAALLLWLHYGRRGASLGPERAVLELLGLEPPKGTLEVAAEARRAARALEVAVEAWWAAEEGEGDAVALQLLVAEGDRLAQAWLALTAPAERPAARRRLRAVFGFARELGGVCAPGAPWFLCRTTLRWIAPRWLDPRNVVLCEVPPPKPPKRKPDGTLEEEPPPPSCWTAVEQGWCEEVTR